MIYVTFLKNKTIQRKRRRSPWEFCLQIKDVHLQIFWVKMILGNDDVQVTRRVYRHNVKLQPLSTTIEQHLQWRSYVKILCLFAQIRWQNLCLLFDLSRRILYFTNKLFEQAFKILHEMFSINRKYRSK